MHIKIRHKSSLKTTTAKLPKMIYNSDWDRLIYCIYLCYFWKHLKKPPCMETPEPAAHCNCICSLLKFFLHRIFCSQVLFPLEFPGLFSATSFFFFFFFLLLFACLFNSLENYSSFSWGCNCPFWILFGNATLLTNTKSVQFASKLKQHMQLTLFCYH